MSLRTNILNWLERPLGSFEWVTLIAVTSAIVAAIGVFAGASSDRNIERRFFDEELARVSSIAYTRGEIARLRGDLAQLERRMVGSGKTGVDSVDTSRFRAIENRLATIEKGLVDSPERALSLPLMRRDIQSLETSSKQEIAATREDIDRLYTLMMWLIGIIITVALGVLGILITRPRAASGS